MNGTVLSHIDVYIRTRCSVSCEGCSSDVN